MPVDSSTATHSIPFQFLHFFYIFYLPLHFTFSSVFSLRLAQVLFLLVSLSLSFTGTLLHSLFSLFHDGKSLVGFSPLHFSRTNQFSFHFHLSSCSSIRLRHLLNSILSSPPLALTASSIRRCSRPKAICSECARHPAFFLKSCNLLVLLSLLSLASACAL